MKDIDREIRELQVKIAECYSERNMLSFNKLHKRLHQLLNKRKRENNE